MRTGRSAADDTVLVELARGGDQRAYGDLVDAYRPELHAHCYRMLASYHDAEDALQDALVRAWRGLPGFEGRSSLRAWLYKIATNSALNLARRRSRRELPASHGPAAANGEGAGAPLLEMAWVEPYPDQWAGPARDGSPEGRYEERESLELAFIAALQYLPPAQRAVLILRDVLGFSAQEVADQLGTSVPSVTSALQRARAATQRRVPHQSQQATLRSLGDQRTRELIEAYVDALERADTPALVGMLAHDVALAMPPLPGWYRGREAVAEFLTRFGFNERWRHLPTHANGQLALGCYTLDRAEAPWVPSAINLVRLEGDKVAESNYFLTTELLRRWGADGAFMGAEVFPLFGLPVELR
ncbi:MAG TPA: RNA polymerase subunit sigma-70 [Acidimicrobiales bacterium]|nr:RNA polymerase subunit sigma-70 [Acidimicrobiales bacterium]